MSNKIELNDEELDLVSGGDISYTWNGTSGRIGIDGNNKYILVDKDAFVAYYNKAHGNESDGAILAHLLKSGIARKA